MSMIKKLIIAATFMIALESITPLYAMGDSDEKEAQCEHVQGEASAVTTTSAAQEEASATSDTVTHANECLFEILKHPWQHIDMNTAIQMLDDGADVNALYEPAGYTPLHYAALKHHGYDTTLTELLLARKADVNAVDKQGATPLIFAARKGAPALVKILLAHHADPNRATNSQYGYHLMQREEKGKQTPLHAATHHWQTPFGREIIQMLIDADANVHAVDANGRTPLHIAALRSRPALAELFIDAHANTHTLDADKKSPLDTAISFNRHAIQYLRDMKKPLSSSDTLHAQHIIDVLNYHASLLKMLVTKEVEYYMDAVKEMLNPEEMVQTLLATQCATSFFTNDCLAALYEKIGQTAAQDTSILQSALAAAVQNSTHASELASDPAYSETFLQTLSALYAVCADNPSSVAAMTALSMYGIYKYRPSLYRSAYQKMTGLFRVGKNITKACYHSLCDTYNLQTRFNIVSNDNTALRTRLALQAAEHARELQTILDTQATHADNNNAVDILDMAMPQLLLPILQEKRLISLIKEYVLEKEYTPDQQERAHVWREVTHLWEQEKIQQRAHHERMARASDAQESARAYEAQAADGEQAQE